ncbi:MAG TPA: GGDEF domain-containing protein [Anaeromyxobacteraceae bacterium]|nr:GGDEF domain-containing protein [Anaeromyxobacteraceae bacterium]
MSLHVQHLLSQAPLGLLVLLAACCLLLTAALVRARRRVAELTLIDPVTAVGSRRLMERELPREIGRARRAGLFLFVGVADVDRLEPYNRAYGRPAGHALLAGIGAVFRSSLRRAGDHTFRSGGDQFTFAFSSERRVDGAEMAERIRARVVGLNRPHAGNPPHGTVTVSIGLVLIEPGAEASLPAIAARAAEALALARKEGRNRVAGLEIGGERFRTGEGLSLTLAPSPSPTPRAVASTSDEGESAERSPR